MESNVPVLSELDLTLLVPCYNEEGRIAETLKSLVSAVREFFFSWEVLVIDDASTDGSVAAVEHFQREHPDLPIQLYVNETNQGFGYCYVQGAYLGRGEYYRVICGDNSEPRETLVEVFRHVGAADVVVPYYVNDTGRTWFRNTLSGAYTRLVNLISGHRIRYYNGLILARRYDVMRWHGNYRGFGIQADLLTRLLDEGLSFAEVGVWDYEQKHGQSTALKFKNIASVTHTLLDLAVRRVGKLLYPREYVASRRVTTARPHPSHGSVIRTTVHGVRLAAPVSTATETASADASA